VSERLRGKNLPWTDPKTPITGLYLTGADVSSLGIMGAMMGGIVTLSNLPEGISIPQVFTTAMKHKYDQLIG
jgi:all-trans-retinol 13,14-reductase